MPMLVHFGYVDIQPHGEAVEETSEYQPYHHAPNDSGARSQVGCVIEEVYGFGDADGNTGVDSGFRPKRGHCIEEDKEREISQHGHVVRGSMDKGNRRNGQNGC